jgi:hypothetical protein
MENNKNEKNKFKKVCLNTLFFLGNIADDILIVSGIAIAIHQTYKLNLVAGNYALGITLFILGVILANRN